MKKTFIVCIPLEENHDARKQCENIENHTFKLDNITAYNVRGEVIKLIDDDVYDLSTIEVEALTDFMDRVNDEAFNPDHYFISYVHAEQKED
jgi:hypothetical protein